MNSIAETNISVAVATNLGKNDFLPNRDEGKISAPNDEASVDSILVGTNANKTTPTVDNRKRPCSSISIDAVDSSNAGAALYINKSIQKYHVDSQSSTDQLVSLCSDPNYLLYIVNDLKTKQAEFQQKAQNAQVFYERFQHIKALTDAFVAAAPSIVPNNQLGHQLVSNLNVLSIHFCECLKQCVAVTTAEASGLFKELQMLELLIQLVHNNIQQKAVQERMTAIRGSMEVPTSSSNSSVVAQQQEQHEIEPVAKKQKTTTVVESNVVDEDSDDDDCSEEEDSDSDDSVTIETQPDV